jgi:hypothetical protein
MFQDFFLGLLVIAWTLVVLAAFCPFRRWLRRRAEAVYDEKKRSLTPVKDR